MQVIADVSIVPIGEGKSVSNEIKQCVEILSEAGLKHRVHAHGTNVEGEWDTVCSAVKRCHEKLHEKGAVRISSTLRMGTRTDKQESLEGKVSSVGH